MGVIAWLLVSLVVYLESLHGQSSIAFSPQAIMAPGWVRSWLYLNLSVRFNLAGPHIKSLVMLTLPHM